MMVTTIIFSLKNYILLKTRWCLQRKITVTYFNKYIHIFFMKRQRSNNELGSRCSIKKNRSPFKTNSFRFNKLSLVIQQRIIPHNIKVPSEYFLRQVRFATLFPPQMAANCGGFVSSVWRVSLQPAPPPPNPAPQHLSYFFTLCSLMALYFCPIYLHSSCRAGG